MTATEWLPEPARVGVTRNDHGDVVEIVIRAPHDDQPLTRRQINDAIRHLNHELQRAEIRHSPATHNLDTKLALRNDLKTLRDQHGATSDVFLAGVAAVYAVVLAEGQSPAEVIAMELDITPGSVNRYIVQARKAGMLTPAMQGRSGGELTSKARETLKASY